MSTKKVFTHVDKLQQSLTIDDIVAYPDHNSMEIGKISKLNEKMLTLQKIGKYRGICHKYPHDTIKLNQHDALLFLLKEQ